jgi:hypothetical protein
MKIHHAPLLIVALFAFGAPPVSHAFADADVLSSSKGGGAAPKEESGKSKGPTDVTGGRFAGDPIYVHIDPMILPVINDSGVEQLVTVILDVQVKDFDAADVMHANMPRVMDSLMTALYGGLGQGTLRNGKLVDVSRVKSKAIDAVGKVIGSDNVRDVLVQSVSQRML